MDGIQPRLLMNVEPGMREFDEETFDPLFSMIKVKDEAIEFANASRYGLCSNSGRKIQTRQPASPKNKQQLCI